MSRYPVNARNRAKSTEWSRFPPQCAKFGSVGSPRAGRVFEWTITQPIVRDDPWHHIDLLCIRALTLARAFAVAACSEGPRARRSRSLIILTARAGPIGLYSRHRLILLASHRMALIRERKNSSQIALEIEIFSNFAWLIPTLVPKHNSRFWVFCCRTCWSWWSIKFMKHLVEIKILRLAQKQVQFWGRRLSSILGFRSPNFAQRKIDTLGFGRRNIGKWNFDHW